MNNYIFEKVSNTTKHFKFGGIEVSQTDQLPEDFNLQSILKTIEKNLPPLYFKGLKKIDIVQDPDFDKRGVNALYRDGVFIISPKQKNVNDLIDDIVHEFAHHVETLFPENIYSDQRLINEFLKKRQELKFELQSEGYWLDQYDFDNLKYDEQFDNFLYKRVGGNMLRMVTTGSFIRPYASVSLREYFATGFEAYYLGKQNTLEKISPMLYDKINELHHQNEY
jgi:hypothetical protein|tara:strand:- start:179 stop:847 length:669 start_codon:yes stop_codon:yes gene_type:complete